MDDRLPEVHRNEGRILGRFELPPADMQHIRYQGRVVIVLVADANEVLIKDTKDGDTQALWKFSGVDAAIVRDPGMVTHLANVLYLDGTDEIAGTFIGGAPEFPPLPQDELTPKTLVGQWDNEGGFLGFEAEEPLEEDEEVTEARKPAGPGPRPRPDIPEPEVRIEKTAAIKHRDPVLEKFLNTDAPSGVRI